MTDPERVPTSAERAEAAARQGKPELATAWALVSIASDLAELRRDVHWFVRGGAARRG